MFQFFTAQLNITQEVHQDDKLVSEVQSLSKEVLQPTCIPTVTEAPSTGTAAAPDTDVTRTSPTDVSRILQGNESPLSRNDDTHQPPHLDDTNDANETLLRRISKDLETNKSNLKIKDNEFELLNIEVNSTYIVVGFLQQRVSEHEQKSGNSGQCETATNVSTPSFCPQLGDSNFRRVLWSDLDNDCSIKTIVKANMNLLSGWVSENL